MTNDKIMTHEKPLTASPGNGQTSNGHAAKTAQVPPPNSKKFEPVQVAPAKVHEVLERHMLADGLDLVVDLKKSKGSWIEDARSGKRYLDFFTFFGSSPIGLNHPKMFEPEFLSALTRAAVNKPSSSDAYSVEMAEFVETFARIAMPEYLPHLFLI
jgi:L-lysine 6-transaminase